MSERRHYFMYGICVYYDEFFADDLDIQLLLPHKGDKKFLKEISFIDSDNTVYDIDNVKKLLVERMKTAFNQTNSQYKNYTFQRMEKGRYNYGNSVAQKMIVSDEDVYLLRLLCNNMDEVADLLGVCRQTVSKAIKRYETLLV